MGSPSPSSGLLLLTCCVCGYRESLELTADQMRELSRTLEVRLFCPDCQEVTVWSGVPSERRSGLERRASHRVRVTLPIRVRCTLPELNFTEVTHTLTASYDGASFASHYPLKEGMEVRIAMPYGEDDLAFPEQRAKVTHVQERGDEYEIGIQFHP